MAYTMTVLLSLAFSYLQPVGAPLVMSSPLELTGADMV